MRNDRAARAYLGDAEPAFYGSPEGVPASELFEKEDAEAALEKAERMLAVVREAFARYRLESGE